MSLPDRRVEILSLGKRSSRTGNSAVDIAIADQLEKGKIAGRVRDHRRSEDRVIPPAVIGSPIPIALAAASTLGKLLRLS